MAIGVWKEGFTTAPTKEDLPDNAEYIGMMEPKAPSIHEMSRPELQRACKAAGIKTSNKTKKAEMIALLEGEAE
jgi:hypothetical protein